MAGEILTVDAGGFVKYTALSSSQLPASGVAAGTYGDATHVGQVTVDAAGRVTAASNVAITGGGGGGGGIGSSSLIYRYTVTGSDKASIDTGVDTPDAGSNDWTNCNLLEVFFYARSDDTGTNPSVTLNMNNDAGSNYDIQWNRLFDTGAANLNNGGTTSIKCQTAGAGIADTSIFGQMSFTFLNPTGLVGYKPFFGTFGYTDPGDTTQNEVTNLQGTYRSASALSRLRFAPVTAGKKFKIGSQLLIYKRLAS